MTYNGGRKGFGLNGITTATRCDGGPGRGRRPSERHITPVSERPRRTGFTAPLRGEPESAVEREPFSNCFGGRGAAGARRRCGGGGGVPHEEEEDESERDWFEPPDGSYDWARWSSLQSKPAPCAATTERDKENYVLGYIFRPVRRVLNDAVLGKVCLLSSWCVLLSATNPTQLDARARAHRKPKKQRESLSRGASRRPRSCGSSAEVAFCV